MGGHLCNIMPILLSFFFIAFTLNAYSQGNRENNLQLLENGFQNPPASARPGVYWYFMDGWMSEKGITEDLESMKKAGIGRVIFLEVNVGIPRGPVNFLSSQWYKIFKYAVAECRRLGIAMTLGVGPGWAGSGGPWITPAQSMQQLVSSSIEISGPGEKSLRLPLPEPKKPYFGVGTLTPELKQEWESYYKDVAVLAFPTPKPGREIKDINEEALYYRAPFSSVPGVKPFLPTSVNFAHLPDRESILKNQMINLTDKLQPDGTLNWNVPPGNWTIMRFVSRNTGALTRPAPIQGMGFECNKMDTTDVKWQLISYAGKILSKMGKLDPTSPGGLKTLHLDSWEMGSQNWTPDFRKEFIKRRGYDPLPFYPIYAGDIVGSEEISERFLWDLRETCNELVIDYYAKELKKYAHRHGLDYSNEPYDMNPSADLELGAVADVPMGEFWSKGYGFNTAFSCIEATSIGHVDGKSVIQGEAFTSDANEAWKQYPGSMKDQGDWAFAMGINRFYFHTFTHKPLADSLEPGMTMGPYGVHWDRKQAWWPMVSAYHRYISRCQFILQQGKPVADILYLTPEGAPQVFIPPASAMAGDSILPDKRGYSFDGCSPKQLLKAITKNHEIVFPSGASYHLLVLPDMKTMTPALLEKISSLVHNGAIVVGEPPVESPSLSGFPECDKEVKTLALRLWGGLELPMQRTTHKLGEGKVIWGGDTDAKGGNMLYPDYTYTAAILNELGVVKDFEADAPIRYTHRATKDWDIYFVSNRTDQKINANCTFHSDKGSPQLWNPVTGKIRMLSKFFRNDEGCTIIPLQFDAYQSFFIFFSKKEGKISSGRGSNFPDITKEMALRGPWTVSFDPKWGGPEKILFDSLTDWTKRPETGIKYYSGIATYQKTFRFSTTVDTSKDKRIYLNLGTVKDMAHVWLNGKDLGIVWTAPWRVDVTGILKNGDNYLKIAVANLWPNRLIGDDHLQYDGIKNGKFPEWFTEGKKRTSGRYAFTTYDPYNKESPLLPSGLLGPVIIEKVDFDK